MPWLKVSDTAADHQIPLNVLVDDDADDRLVNETFGFVLRCAVKSAQQELDYVVPRGTAIALAGSVDRFRVLAAVAERAGYWSRATVEGADGAPREVFKLVEDEDGLFGMILRDERAWTRAQKQDTRNPEMTLPVRVRDGDACRWCGQVVKWADKKSGRGGTYDHLKPGVPATSPEDLVVACRKCNGTRQKAEKWDVPLRSAPSEPYYSPSTVGWLAKHDIVVVSSERRRPVEPVSDADRQGEQPGPVQRTAEQRPQEQPAAAAAPTPGARAVQAPTGNAPASAAPGTEVATPAEQETPARPTERPTKDAAPQEGALPVEAPVGSAPGTPSADAYHWEADDVVAFVATPTPDQVIDPDPRSARSGSAGTGQDGSGRDRSGQDWAGSGQVRSGLDGELDGEGQSKRRRRGRRGRRGGRGRGGGQ